jgi:hypothetical protein
MVSRNSITERNAFLSTKRNEILTAGLSAQLSQWEWDAEWPVVDTDGCLTGKIVGPDPDYTVVDVMQAPSGDYYATAYHNGSVGSMAMCPTASMQQRERLLVAAGECECHENVVEVSIAEGPRGWIAVVAFEAANHATLVSLLRQIGRLQP